MSASRERDGAAARVVSVNVGLPREVEWLGETVSTGIFKHPVSGPVAVRGINLRGDAQADLEVHGGPDKAVYAYAADDYRWWEKELGVALAPASFGENLTIEGLDVCGALIGERWRVGTTVLEVAQPRFPCFKIGLRMNDATFPRRFARALRNGAYLRIIEEGVLAAGDEVEVVSRPRHGWTIREVARVREQEPRRMAELLEIEGLGAHLLASVRRRVERDQAAPPRS